ncbi:MAG: hypothetical protein JWR04_2977 [Rhodoglobus sp.]|nr:hypothetical protein [Rhodoglobus sp.]
MPPILALECLWDDGGMRTPIVFRPWTGIAVTVLVGAVVVVSLAGLAIAGDFESLRRFGPAFVALAVVTAALFVWPAVIVGPEGVVVRNPFRTAVVPWSRIDGMETRVGLKLLLLPSGSVSAWAAPAPSRRTSARLLRYSRLTGSKGANDALDREALARVDGPAGTVIRRELTRLERTPSAVSAPGVVVRRANIPVIAVVVAVVVAAVVFSLT